MPLAQLFHLVTSVLEKVDLFFRRTLEEVLQPTITSKDKLSSFAVSILHKEKRLVGGDDIQASRYLFTIDLTKAIEQLKEAVKTHINEVMTEEFPEPGDVHRHQIQQIIR